MAKFWVDLSTSPDAFDARVLPSSAWALRVHGWLKKQMSSFSIFRNTELSITSKQTRLGSVEWSVYDPVTHQYFSFTSEDALRIWLDTRHYR